MNRIHQNLEEGYNKIVFDEALISGKENKSYGKFSFKTIFIFYYIIKALWNKEKTLEEAKLMRIAPNNSFLLNSLRFSEHRIMRVLTYFKKLKISVDEFVYLKKESFSSFFEMNDKYGFNWNLLKKRFKVSDLDKTNLFGSDLFSKSKDKETRIRFMNNENFSINNKIRKNDFSLTNKEKKFLKNIIIYIHGGGFSAMNSETLTNPLIRMAKQTGCSIFCIDYPYSPEIKSPEILHSIYYSYIYITVY